ncbi:MAG: AAA family ATPase, partial [Methanosphaera sp. rholeuAM130]
MMDEYQIRSYLMNLLRITPQSVKLILENNYEYLKRRDLYFELKDYLDEFIDKPNQNKFFVVPGLRGVGKSTMIYQLYDYLLNTKKIASNKILLLDLEQLKYEKNLKIMDYFNVFIKQINEKYYLTNEPLFIFVDESQYDAKWDWAGKLVYDEHVNVFIIFTGSNALNLSYSADA